jgi:hypothetical protein
MFVLGRVTNQHALPDMHQTFEVLGEYLQNADAHVKRPGRTGYEVKNAADVGLDKLLAKTVNGNVDNDNESNAGDVPILE